MGFMMIEVFLPKILKSFGRVLFGAKSEFEGSKTVVIQKCAGRGARSIKEEPKSTAPTLIYVSWLSC